MNIVVPINFVPDLVEELSIADSGKDLDREWVSLMLNEFDDHAIEQAILLKERTDAEVTVMAPDVEGVDDALATASARGADRLIKLEDDFEAGASKHALARAYAAAIPALQPDLVLTGVQAHDDLDGTVGPLLAEYLGMPYVGYISGVEIGDGAALVRKEYPGGLIAEMEVMLPAVLGIQAADQPPRYVAFSKIRQAMQSAEITELEAEIPEDAGAAAVVRMRLPEASERAEMIEGDEEEVASRLVELFEQAGIL